MKPKYLIPLAAVALTLTACIVTSVYPFYTEKDVMFDARIAGSWTNSTDADEQWLFENAGTNGYRLEYSNAKKTTNNISVTLFRLQDTTFMDLVTRDTTDTIQPPPIPSHMLFRVTLSADRIKMTPLNYEWIEKLVNKNPKAIRHYVVADPEHPEPGKGLVVLTADTGELQKFVIKNLKTEDAWKDPIELIKVSAGSAAAK